MSKSYTYNKDTGEVTVAINMTDFLNDLIANVPESVPVRQDLVIKGLKQYEERDSTGKQKNLLDTMIKFSLEQIAEQEAWFTALMQDINRIWKAEDNDSRMLAVKLYNNPPRKGNKAAKVEMEV